MSRPLALSDDQMTMITRAAEPLQPADRGPFLQRVATLLNGHELGDGVISRAARQAQAEFFRAPDLSKAKAVSKYR
jgi:hypothetical protein